MTYKLAVMVKHLKCHGSYDGLSANILIDLRSQFLKGVYRLFQLVSRKNVIYAGALYDTMYLPVSPISTSCNKYTGHLNDCLYEKYKTNIALHFSSKVPGALTKNVKTFCFTVFTFLAHLSRRLTR